VDRHRTPVVRLAFSPHQVKLFEATFLLLE
jgi:hypothetical protein